MVIEPELEAYFYRTRDLWKGHISKHFALDFKLLEENEAYLDWYLVSQNKAIKWNPKIVERFESNWDWRKLTRNGALYRRIKDIDLLISLYSDRWSWKYLQKRRKFLLTDELLELNRCRKVRFTDVPPFASDIYALRFPESLDHWLERPKEQWKYMPGCFRYASHWDGVERDGFRELLKNHKEQVNWTVLSSFSRLTAELIQEFEDNWDWMVLSRNPSLPYSLSFLQQYMRKWKWPIHVAHGGNIAAGFTGYLSSENSFVEKYPQYFTPYEHFNYSRSPEHAAWNRHERNYPLVLKRFIQGLCPCDLRGCQ